MHATPLRRRKPLRAQEKSEYRTDVRGKKKSKKQKIRHATVALCDKIARDCCLVRDHGRCVVCGSRDHLQASHIYPKGLYRHMRWQTANIEIRCAGDHKFKKGSPHGDPAGCATWWRNHLDAKRRAFLHSEALRIVEVTPWFRDAECDRLKAEYKRLTGREWHQHKSGELP